MVMLRPLAARAARSVRAMSVAKVAHVLILCLNETGVPVLALLTRRSGKGYEKLRYVHRTPKGASGRSYLPGRKVAYGRVAVNRCERRPHRGLEKRIAAHLRRRFKRNNSEFWHAQFFAARHGDPNLRPPDWRSGSHRRRPILRSRARGSFRSGRHPRTGLRKSGLRPAWSPRYRAIPCRAPCQEFRSRKCRASHHPFDEPLYRFPCPRLLVWGELAAIVERRAQRRKSRMV